MAIALLALLIVPGEFLDSASAVDLLGVKALKFEHGWPWVHLTREVDFAPDIIRKIELAHQAAAPPPVDLPHHGIPWLQRWAWSMHGDLVGVRALGYRTRHIFRPGVFVADLVVGILLLLILAKGLEWRHRRRRIWQLSLADILGTTLLVSAALVWWVGSTHQSRRERDLAAKCPGTSVKFEYCGPLWFRRLVGLASTNAFQQVVYMDVENRHDPNALRVLRMSREFPRLQSLTIRSRSEIPGGMALVGRLVQLRELTLRAPVSDADFSCLCTLRSLRILSALECDLLAADAMDSLNAMRDLEELRLSGSGINTAGIGGLPNFKKLKLLDLANTAVDDGALQYVGNLASLRQLGLAKTRLDGSGLRHLGQLSHLESLDLSGTAIGDDDLHSLGRMAALRVINVRGTRVTELGLRELQAALPQCSIRR